MADKVRLEISEVGSLEYVGPKDGPPPVPCTGCPEFDAVTYPSTPNSAEEYDSFCGAVEEGELNESVFLMFMECQHDEGDRCPYKDRTEKIERLELISKAAEQVYGGEIGFKNPKHPDILALGVALYPHRAKLITSCHACPLMGSDCSRDGFGSAVCAPPAEES